MDWGGGLLQTCVYRKPFNMTLQSKLLKKYYWFKPAKNKLMHLVGAYKRCQQIKENSYIKSLCLEMI